MKFSLTFVLIFIGVVKSQNLDDFQLFSQCDRTVGTGVATCMQYFSPIKFVTDFLKSDKESLCCTHFKHTACISGVRDAVRMAKAANLCPDSFADEVVSTLTDSTVNNYIRKSCKTFNTGVCVMESVGDVVNTIQGFFVPQQQKPVVPQLIQSVPRIFNRNGGNYYSNDDNRRNHNYDSDRSSLFNPFREIINPRKIVTTTTPSPIFEGVIGDLFDRRYIPDASNVSPTKVVSDENQTQFQDPLRSLFRGFIDTAEEANERKDSSTAREPSILESFGSFLNLGLNNNRNIQNKTNGQNFFGDIFNLNETNSTIVRDITDSLN